MSLGWLEGWLGKPLPSVGLFAGVAVFTQPALGGLVKNLIGLAGGSLEGLARATVAGLSGTNVKKPASESNLGLPEEPCDELTDVVGLDGGSDIIAA